MKESHRSSPLLTILVCTYNRAADLAQLLDSVLEQRDAPYEEYEILVVDNNSTDSTRTVVAERSALPGAPLHYIFEARQGKSYALNSGLERAAGNYYAVVDDDLLLPRTYVRDLLNALREHGDKSALGGKVLPLYEREPPDWLTSDDWAPIAMADFGSSELGVGPERPICLMAATLRMADVRAMGGYRTDLGVRGRGVIGGTEDAELMQRLWRAGHRGVYLPHLVLHHKVPAARLRRSHFLKWHYGHGRSRALGRDPVVERSRARLFDVPAHMYRAAFRHAVEAAVGIIRRDGSGFRALGRLAFFAGFLRQRVSMQASTKPGAVGGEEPGSGR